MNRSYTEEEKKKILQELEIDLLNGMIKSSQAAKIMSKRAEIEVGEKHEYDDNSVRWRVKSKKLVPAYIVNDRLKLFHIDDIFNLDLEPQKWHSRRKSRKSQKDQ